MCTLMIVIAVIGAPLAQAAQLTVEAAKAAYLFRFAQYVEWPSLEVDSPFVIAISGAEDVAVHLEHLLPGMSVNGHRVVVRRVTRPQELDGVHILYIGAKAFARTRALRAQAIERPILVVTDHEFGLDGGGIINFIEVEPQSAVRDLVDCRGPQRPQDRLTNCCPWQRASSAGRRARSIASMVIQPDSAPISATPGWPA